MILYIYTFELYYTLLHLLNHIFSSHFPYVPFLWFATADFEQMLACKGIQKALLAMFHKYVQEKYILWAENEISPDKD